MKKVVIAAAIGTLAGMGVALYPTAAQAQVNCNCFGAWTCASNQYDAEYTPPGCGGLTRLQAENLCKSHCGGVACTDSGWQGC